MPLIIGSGWEWGFLDLASANNNEGTHDSSPTIVSGAWAGSTYALRCNPAGAAVADYNFSGLGPLGNLVATSVPDSYFRIDWKSDLAPAANYEPIFRFDNVSAAHAKFTLCENSSKQLVALDRNGTLMQTGVSVMPQSTQITLYVHVGTGANAPWEVRIGSATATPEISGTGNLDTVNGGEIRIGKATNLFSQTVDFSYDNFAWRDDHYPVPGVMILLAPVADGFYANGTPNGFPSLWQCINQIPTDGDTSYINGLTIGQAYTAKVAQLPYGLVNYLMTLASAKRDGGVSTATGVRLRIGTSDNDTATTQATLGPNYNVFRAVYETNPLTGLPWVANDVNSAQVGIIQADGNPARLSTAAIMVEYQPGIAPPFAPVTWSDGLTDATRTWSDGYTDAARTWSDGYTSQGTFSNGG